VQCAAFQTQEDSQCIHPGQRNLGTLTPSRTEENKRKERNLGTLTPSLRRCLPGCCGCRCGPAPGYQSNCRTRQTRTHSSRGSVSRSSSGARPQAMHAVTQQLAASELSFDPSTAHSTQHSTTQQRGITPHAKPTGILTCGSWCRCTSKCRCARSLTAGGRTGRRCWTWQKPSCGRASGWHLPDDRFLCWPVGGCKGRGRGQAAAAHQVSVLTVFVCLICRFVQSSKTCVTLKAH
jgi:hypothetical protein